MNGMEIGILRRELAECRAECADLRREMAEMRQFLPWMRAAARFVPGFSTAAHKANKYVHSTGILVNCARIVINGQTVTIGDGVTVMNCGNDKRVLFELLAGLNPVNVVARAVPQPYNQACDHLTEFAATDEVAGWTNLESVEFCSGVVKLDKLAKLPKLREITVWSASDVSVLAGSAVKVLKYSGKLGNPGTLAGTGIVLLKA